MYRAFIYLFIYLRASRLIADVTTSRRTQRSVQRGRPVFYLCLADGAGGN